MATRKKRRKSILLPVLVFCVSAFMVFKLAGLWTTLNEHKKKLADLKVSYAQEERSIENLKKLLSDGSQSEIIEKAARERLGYVYSNEEIYVDISGD